MQVGTLGSLLRRGRLVVCVITREDLSLVEYSNHPIPAAR